MSVGRPRVSRDMAVMPESAQRGDLADQASVATAFTAGLLVGSVIKQMKDQAAIFRVRQEWGLDRGCVSCGEEIAENRRKAISTAIRCLTCEEQREKN